jgi:hypothetical protein
MQRYSISFDVVGSEPVIAARTLVFGHHILQRLFWSIVIEAVPSGMRSEFGVARSPVT